MPLRAKQIGAMRKELLAFDMRAERVARCLTQDQVAEILHTSKASISRWETGTLIPLIYLCYWRLYWQQHTQQRPKRGKRKPRAAVEASTIEATTE